MDGGGDVPNKAPLMPPRNIRRPGYEAYFPATVDEVSLDEMLSLVCRQRKKDIVELLLESGANVNHRNKAGNTPLLEACSQGHVDSARMLLDRGANIDTPTETTLDSALGHAPLEMNKSLTCCSPRTQTLSIELKTVVLL